MTVTTSVDLSRLPPPEVVETLAYEQIFNEMLADLIARDSEITALVESDPAYKILQVAAYREMILRQRVNDAAKNVLLAYATKAFLDNLAAFYGVTRLTIDPGDPDHAIAPTMESDDDMRRRCAIAPSGYSTAGPDDAYIFHALSASGSVLDAKPTSPTPGAVVVSVLSRTGDGTADTALLATVNAALSAQTVRPLTDHVTVQSAAIVPFAIAGTRYTFGGPDSGLVLAESDRRLAAYLADARRLDRDIPLSALYAALHCDGIQRIVLTSPAADIAISDTQAAHCTSIALAYGGIDE
ncbi:MAG TPA: baseplate J/gp47 family protein [Rhodanobacter sp.]|nr:baseplate J/gp47 family protein [Rhodanobacter sp.]